MTITGTFHGVPDTDTPAIHTDRAAYKIARSGAPGPADAISLPLPPALGDDKRFEMEIYARFMRHLRQVPHSCMDIKILSSLQFTADHMGVQDDLVAKTLVDLGLRAPRRAFPAAFVAFADRALQRNVWDSGTTPLSVLALKDHWDKIGEDRFGPSVRTHYSVVSDRMYRA